MNDKWRVVYALTRINGIGWSLSNKIMSELKIDESKRVSQLNADDLGQIAAKLDGYTIEGDLVRKIRGNIQRLREVGTYRGMRHARGLPVRGQRTKTNARTKRGKRKTVGAFKKDVLTKMQQNTQKEEAKSGKK